MKQLFSSSVGMARRLELLCYLEKYAVLRVLGGIYVFLMIGGEDWLCRVIRRYARPLFPSPRTTTKVWVQKLLHNDVAALSFLISVTIPESRRAPLGSRSHSLAFGSVGMQSFPGYPSYKGPICSVLYQIVLARRVFVVIHCAEDP